MIAKLIAVATIGVVIFAAGPVMAQSCTTPLTATQLRSLLDNKYGCGCNSSECWNELHESSTGNVLDYKKGPTDPIDPSDTDLHPTGSYSYTTIGRSTAAVKYTYGSSSFTYTVQQIGTTNQYYFCPSGGGTTLTITVQASHC